MAALVIVVVALALALSLALASVSRRSGPGKRAVIVAALNASGWKGVFPSRETKQSCTIHGGGPAPGTFFPGATCRTRVLLDDGGSATVFFTHWIYGDPHTWVYAVSRSLRVRFVRDFGRGIAPEWWA